jgi:hypothetical protein
MSISIDGNRPSSLDLPTDQPGQPPGVPPRTPPSPPVANTTAIALIEQLTAEVESGMSRSEQLNQALAGL